MSFTMSAPAFTAGTATAALQVSMEIAAFGNAWRSAANAGRTRSHSSTAPTDAAPGRVDSPPRSRMSAPAASIAPARSTTVCGDGSSPPSENESGVTFSTPMTSVRPPGPGSGRSCGLCQVSG